MSYQVSPTLPTGLSLNGTTGAITGTPSVAASVQPYTITATNSGGSTSTVVSITVNDVIPPNPGGFSATTLSSSQISLSWIPSGRTGFVIAYQAGFFFPQNCAARTGVTIVSVAPNLSSILISGLTPVTQYGFRICSIEGTIAANLAETPN